MNLDKVKSNIRAMLALMADDAASDGEKTNAMRHVTRLMEQYNLSDEDLVEADSILDSLDNVAVGQQSINCGPQLCSWYSALARFVQDLLDKTVKAACIRDHATKQVSIVFYGILADCEIAAGIFHEVRGIIDELARAKYGKSKRGDGYRYCMGFVGGLQGQLKRVKDSTPTNSTALVIARNAIVIKKQEIANRWSDDNGLKLKSMAKPRVQRDEAFNQGWHDGLHHNVNTDRRKKLTA
jgi:hypothetical protein